MTYKWYIAHTENNDALMFRRILRYPSQMCFEHVVSIEEGHLAIWLNPNLHSQCKSASIHPIIIAHANLEFCILGQTVESSDVQLELATFGELAKTRSETNKVRSCNGYAESH